MSSKPSKLGADIDELMHVIETNQAAQEKEFPVERHRVVTIETDEPMAVVFSSDWHLGGCGVDYGAFRKDTEFLLDHSDELRLVTCGDLVDSFRTFKNLSCVLDQALSPKMQARLLMHLAERLSKSKMYLAACFGNHDNMRCEAMYGESPIAAMLAKYTAFFDGIGLLTIVLKNGKHEEKYTILFTHMARNNSALDRNHGAKKLYLERFPADCTVTAHRHAPSIQQDTHYEDARQMGYPFGGQRIMIACGTYKNSDLLGRRFYPTEGQIGAPCVLFSPNEHRMEVFRSAESALIYKEGMRHWKVSK
jgi:hypothetical protein